MLYRLIDNDGNFIKDVILQEPPTIDVETNIDGELTIVKHPHPNYIVEAPQGLFKPKWDGTAWVEGMTQDGIDTLVKSNRMNEIKVRLLELDIKTFKFIDGQLSAEAYEPFRLEKIALRLEYNTLEEA